MLILLIVILMAALGYLLISLRKKDTLRLEYTLSACSDGGTLYEDVYVASNSGKETVFAADEYSIDIHENLMYIGGYTVKYYDSLGEEYYVTLVKS